MTTYGDVEIARLWIGAGGTSEGAILQWVVSVCLAESGGDDHAVSGQGARGLFQIMPFHHEGGINDSNWTNATVNCRAAIAISGNGQNWSAWASCYVNSNNPPYVPYLHTPEPGSPAYMRVWDVQLQLARAGVLTGTTVAGGASMSPIPGGIAAAWDGVRSYVQHQAPAQWQAIYRTAAGIEDLARYHGG